jgi:hypothetical protein
VRWSVANKTTGVVDQRGVGGSTNLPDPGQARQKPNWTRRCAASGMRNPAIVGVIEKPRREIAEIFKIAS